MVKRWWVPVLLFVVVLGVAAGVAVRSRRPDPRASVPDVVVYLQPAATPGDEAAVRAHLVGRDDVETVTYLDRAGSLAEMHCVLDGRVEGGTGEMPAADVPPSYRVYLAPGDHPTLETDLRTLPGVREMIWPRREQATGTTQPGTFDLGGPRFSAQDRCNDPSRLERLR